MRVALRAPNHLGDGVLALPAVAALAELGPVTVYAPRWGPELYGHLRCRVRPRGVMRGADLAVLLAPSLRAALEALLVRRRLGTPTDRRGLLLTERVAVQRHTLQTYAALAAAAGGSAPGPPRLPWNEPPLERLPAGHVGLNPLSVSGHVRQWRGFRALADRLERPVVFYAGPGEEARIRELAGPHPVCAGLGLRALAGALRRCALFVSVDTGPGHLAGALGVPTLVLYGSTAPDRTGPPGAAALEGSAPCRPCLGHRCDRGLQCLDLDLATVQSAVVEALRG